MFGDVFDKLNTLFGRPFLLASYFPWLIFAMANAAMAQIMTPGLAKLIASYFSGGFYGVLSGVAVCLGVLAAIAYLTDPLILFMTSFLEGAYFPDWLARMLVADQSTQWDELDKEVNRAKAVRSQIENSVVSIKADLEAARENGVKGGQNFDDASITAAEEKMKGLSEARRQQRVIDSAALSLAADRLKKALRFNCADESALYRTTTGEDRKRSRTLGRLYGEMSDLIEYAKGAAGRDHSDAAARRQARFPASIMSRLQSTRFGNEAAALRAMLDDRFNFDFEFFWPIVQIVLQSDEKAADAVVQSKQHLDFCIRIFWFTILFTAIWLLVAAWSARSLYVAPLIGTLGFVACAAWLEIVGASYRSFAELVRGIIVLKRFDVLTALRLPLPATWEEEKDIWQRSAYQLKWGSKCTISYAHADSDKHDQK